MVFTMQLLNSAVLICLLSVTYGYSVRKEMTVIPIEVSPAKGESAVFICQIDGPVDACFIKPPNAMEWTSFNNTNPVLEMKELRQGKRYLYYGNGLEKGECGVVIPVPSPEDSGLWQCKLKAVGDEDTEFIAEVQIWALGERFIEPSPPQDDDDEELQIEEEEEPETIGVLYDDEKFDTLGKVHAPDNNTKRLVVVVFLTMIVFGAVLFAMIITLVRYKYTKKRAIRPPLSSPNGNYYKRLIPDITLSSDIKKPARVQDVV